LAIRWLERLADREALELWIMADRYAGSIYGVNDIRRRHWVYFRDYFLTLRRAHDSLRSLCEICLASYFDVTFS